jgi:3-hydroxyisobutyrate dehydrogenase-like beta-hydroxyacid dehydrogenase
MRNITKVSFIGTGSMGRPMIFKLLEKGYHVQVYDKYQENAGTVVAAGAIWKDTPADAAKGCDIVVTCLPLPHHVLENMLGEQGALEEMRSGSTWVDSSTTNYHNTKHIASVADQQGVFSLEAPVSNLSHMGVDFANVAFYVGGDQQGFDDSFDVLNTMGKKSFYVGEIGRGQTVKLFTNMLFYNAMVFWGEVLIIAKATGINLHWMWDFIKASKGNCFATDQVTPFILDGSYDRSCTLEITVKDTDLTVNLADELNVPLPVGRIVEERYRQAGNKYQAHDNHVCIVKLVAEENHMELMIPGFTAPSKYGINTNYIMPNEFVEDQYGRVKPKLPASYQSPACDLDANLINLAQTLTDFMAYIHYVSLQESYLLGRNMKLESELLREVVRWSVGPSWVADHEDSFQPEPEILLKMKALAEKNNHLHLPAIRKFLSLYLP